MPLRDTFNQLKNKLEELNREHNLFPTSSSQQPYQPQHQQYYGTPQPQWQPQQQQYPYQQNAQYPYQQQQQQQQYQYPSGYQQPYQQPSQYNSAPQPSQPYNRPPPVPQYSHPQQQQQQQQPIAQNSKYWQARFDPSIPVSQEWDQKLGNNNGWGNAELEHYTANPENAFFTGDYKLIIRAICNTSSPNPEGKHTSARLVSRQTLARPRGCLTAFLTCPSASGIWPAFWLLPREPFTWPNEGEIDIAESWNGEKRNHSCLHWGFYNAEDNKKHLTMGTTIDDLDRRAVRYDFVWDQTCSSPLLSGRGKMMWYIDGRPVMKTGIPEGTRPLNDWSIVINVAMGGNVCAGQVPRDGAYDFVVHSLYMSDEPEHGGWARFEGDWNHCPEGNTL